MTVGLPVFAATEPSATAILLLGVGVLLALAVLAGESIGRRGVPVVLVFLGVGMLAGSEGIGGIPFDDYAFSFRIGTFALVLILFDGGLNTPWGSLKANWGPATLLATVGVLLTAGLVGLGVVWGLGWRWQEGLLLGAVIASTDAAAVFSVLRHAGVRLRQRVAATLELESGLNDPMAIILTIGLTEMLRAGTPVTGALLLTSALQLAIGGGVGYSLGWLGQRLLHWRPLPIGLYPVLSLGLACFTFAAGTLLNGSGFLAVFLCAMVLGNSPLPDRNGLERAHDFMAWCGQIVMFLTLGLLVFPSQLLPVAGAGLFVAILLVCIARPIAVLLCLLPFRFERKELGFVSWVGLRGAVPIILATIPLMAGLPLGQQVFNIVFFVVVVSTLVQGTTVRWASRYFDMATEAPPPPPARIEIASALPLGQESLTLFVTPESPIAGRALRDAHFPPNASVILISRDQVAVIPRGHTALLPGDYAHILCDPEERETVERMFESPHVADALAT